MRIDRLDLLAYGAFDHRSFPLPAADGSRGLHLLYGPNEAGKSVSLRAIAGLLFGIEAQTNDNFRFEYGKLRLGGVVSREDGTQLEFLRRKGRARTLLAPDGDELGEDCLAPFLGTVDKELFEGLFGLNHDRLRRGGQEIAAGRGNLGEALFSAGLSGAGLPDVLAALEEQAREIFTPRKGKARLYGKLTQYDDLTREVKRLTLSSRDWEHQRRELEALSSRADELSRQEQEHRRDKAHLETLRRCLEPLAKRRLLRTELKKLAGVPALEENVPERRATLQEKLTANTTQQRKLTGHLADRRQRLDAVTVPEEILARESAISDLHQRLESFRETEAECPRLATQVQHHDEAIARLLRDLGNAVSPAEVESLRLDRRRRTAIQKLIKRHVELTGQRDAHSAEVSRRQQALTRAQAALDEAAEPADAGTLEGVLDTVDAAGLEASLHEVEQELAAAQAETTHRLQALGRWQGTAAEFRALALPLPVTVEQHDATLTAAERELADSLREQERLQESLAELQADLARLEREGEVPTAEQLARARKRREEGWQWVRRVWLEEHDSPDLVTPFAEEPLPAAYEHSVRAADDVSDRLRAEAERVTRKTHLLGQREEAQAALRAAGEQVDSAATTLTEEQTRWQAVWADSAITPGTPREMLSWLGNCRELRRHVAAADELETRLKTLTAQRDGALRVVADTARQAGGPEPGQDEALRALVARCRAWVKRQAELKSERTQRAREVKSCEEELAYSRRQQEETTAELAAWQERWEEALAPLALAADTPPDEVEVVLETLQELFRHVDSRDERQGELAGQQERAERFRADVAAAVADLADPPAGDGAGQQVAELHRRLLAAQEVRREAIRLQEQVREKEAELRELAIEQEEAGKELAKLCRLAGVKTADELPEVEQQAARRRELDGKLKDQEDALLDLGGGLSVAELEAQTQDRTDAELAAAIERAERDLAALREEANRLQQELGIRTKDFEAQKLDAQVATKNQELAGVAGAIRDMALEYARLRLARVLLQAEIDRYRQEHETPLLTRSSELFAKLTLGSFARLQTGYDDKDQPQLVGVRPGGEEVTIDGMSDGTCDQLYLALRLSAVEEFLDEHAPVPLVLDDILVDFDDDRAAAALEVLAELSRRTQVLYFTHHGHILDLATRRLPDGAAQVVEIQA